MQRGCFCCRHGGSGRGQTGELLEERLVSDGLAGGSLGERPQRSDVEMVRLLSDTATCGTLGVASPLKTRVQHIAGSRASGPYGLLPDPIHDSPHSLV